MRVNEYIMYEQPVAKSCYSMESEGNKFFLRDFFFFRILLYETEEYNHYTFYSHEKSALF